MDICFLPAWFYDIRGEGGGLFFQEQALAMQAVVEKVSVFYPALEPRYWGPEKWSLTQTHQVAVFKYQGFSFPKRITPLLCYYRRQIATSFAIFLQYREGKLPDLIHAHSLWGAYAALVIKEKWGIPFVYTEHLSKWTATDYNLPRRHLHLLKHIQQRADLVTAVSRRLADKINEACQTQTTLVTPNMVDTDFFTLPATKNNKPKVFHLISIGDPWHKKGLDILLEAVGIAQRQTPTQLKLTLVDRIPDRPPLLALIQKHQLDQQVHFAGRLNREALRAVLQQQDLLVSAARIESFGITMIEALACGVPVIATKTAGSLDILRPGYGVLVEQENPAQLAAAILQQVNSGPELPPAALAQFAEENYGKPAFCARWLTHYAAILDPTNAPRP